MTLNAWLNILFLIILVSIILMEVSENGHPIRTLTWILLLIFLPVIGLILYFYFGRDRKNRRMVSVADMARFQELTAEAVGEHVCTDIPEAHRNLVTLLHTAGQALPVDGNDVLNGDGPAAPNRSGYVPLLPIIKMCYSSKYTESEMKAKISKTGGLISLLGTDDMLKIKERIGEGDQWAALVYDWFAYQLAKYIGSYACVLEGQVDAVVMTGGVSNDEDFIAGVKKYAGWIGKFIVYGGDFEMEALASGAIRALDGVEPTKEYTGVPVWEAFEFEPK